MPRRKNKATEHYVDNAKFADAVVEYLEEVEEAKKSGKPIPRVPNYIAECQMNIAEGLSRRSNFINYTFREEMVMDAVENQLKALKNYDINAGTRTGRPNAFGYFSKVSWFAFLRRIALEGKQSAIKWKYLSQVGIDSLAMIDVTDTTQTSAVINYIDSIKAKYEADFMGKMNSETKEDETPEPEEVEETPEELEEDTEVEEINTDLSTHNLMDYYKNEK